MSPPSSGSKNKPSNQSYLLNDGFTLGLFLDPEDEGDMFFRNIGWFLTDYTVSCPRRQNSS
jgi:hypothetical protein